MANKVLPKHLQERKDQQYMYVDVREADELEEMIEGAVNISLGQLIRMVKHGNSFR